MQIHYILASAEAFLRSNGLSTPRLDAEVLLAACLTCDRLSLYTNRSDPVADEKAADFKSWVTRRAWGEPVAYIVGGKEFWSLDFSVDSNVLIPRPDTEVLVEEVLRISAEYADKDGVTLLDVGTGSGAISVAVAHERRNLTVLAIDSSLHAVKVARKNALRHNVLEKIFFVCGNMLESISGKFDIVVSNPPYISDGEYDTLSREVRDYEPPGALISGPEGTEFHRHLIRGAEDILNRGGWLVMEMGAGQRVSIEDMLRESDAYDRVHCRRDYGGIERVIMARRKLW